MISRQGHRFLISYKIFSEVVSRTFSFLLVIVAAHFLSKSDFGTFSLGWAAGWVAAVLSDFGLQLHLAREVARDPRSARKILGSLIRWKLLLAIAVTGILTVCWSVIGSSINTTSLALLVISQILISLVDFLNHYFRGLSRSDIESTTNLLHRFLCLASAGILLDLQGGLLGCAAALACCSLLALVWTVGIVSRFPLPTEFMDSPPWISPSRSELMRQVFPIGAGIVISTLYFRVDLFLLEWWVGIEAVAVYAAVFRPIDGLRLVPAAVLAVTFPDLCRASTLRSICRTGLLLFSSSIPIILTLGWYSDAVIAWLFGPAYLSGAATFRVLLLSLPLLYLNFALTHQLLAWSLQKNYLLLTLIALAGNLALNATLIPGLGMVGAAWAMLGTEVILTAGCVLILGGKLRDSKDLEE